MLDLRNKNIYVGNQAIDRVYLGEELLKSNEPPIYMATDEDFNIRQGNHVYIGSALEVDITDYVNRKDLTSISYMFSERYDATPVTKLVLGPNNVTNMGYIFLDSKATTLDLSSFNTGSATTVWNMFSGSQATSLDLSSFDTSSVTDMTRMFQNTKATTLDLSSFDTSSATTVWNMFNGAQATIGYARTQADADRFNSSGGKPSGLTFVVHPDLT